MSIIEIIYPHGNQEVRFYYPSGLEEEASLIELFEQDGFGQWNCIREILNTEVEVKFKGPLQSVRTISLSLLPSATITTLFNFLEKRRGLVTFDWSGRHVTIQAYETFFSG